MVLYQSGKSDVQYKIKSHNLGQKVGDKFTKLSKIGFSMECFTDDFLRLLSKNVKIWL